MDSLDHGNATPVSRDMEAIFGPMETAAAEAAPSDGSTVLPMKAGARRGRGAVRRLALPASVAVGVLALTIGLVRQGEMPRQAAPPAPAVALAPEAIRPLGMSEPHVVARAIPYRPKQEAAPRVAAKSDVKIMRVRTNGSCGRLGGDALARCMRPQILVADRQFRNSYRQAVRRGVDRDVLVSTRDQWSGLRRQANSDPRRVAAAYRQMAQRLDAARG